MEGTEQEILLDFVAEALGVPKEQARASLLNDAGVLTPEAKAFLLDTHKTKVKTIKESASSDAYSAAKKAERTALEKEIKTKFGFDSDAVGVDLIEKLLETKIPKGDNIPEEVVKKHPAYITLESKVDERVKTAVKSVEDKYQEMQSKVERDKQNQHILKEGRTLLDAMKPVLPKDAKKAETQLGFFDRMLLELSYEIKESNGRKNILLLDPSDATKVKRLEDDHGNAVKFEDKVQEIAEALYELQEAESRSSAGDPNKKGTSSKGKSADQKFDLKRPASEREYREALVAIDGDSSIDVKTRIAKKAALKELFHGKAA